MSEWIVEKCDNCPKEMRRTAPAAGVHVLFDSQVSDWLKMQLGNGQVFSLCPTCAAPVRELYKNLFPVMPDLPDSDADRGPIQ